MKYTIVKTDLLIDNKLHSEGSEVELTKDQTKGIEDYLIPIKQSDLSGKTSIEAKTYHSERSEESKKKTKSKGNKK